MPSTVPPTTASHPEDYAVLIGVSRYPLMGDLDGPANDVKEMVNWLTDPSGGGLLKDNVSVLVSDEPDEPTGPNPDNARPNLEDVQNVFYPLVKRVLERRGRIGRRLYLYMSGHGYLALGNVVAFLLADASPDNMGAAISVIEYANYFRDSGAFDEVILFADCDQIHEPAIPESRMPGLKLFPEGETLRTTVSTFYAFATQPAQEALEDVFNQTGRVHGLFTKALLEGLKGEAAPAGSVTSETLKSYLEEQVSHLGRGEQRPSFVSTGYGEIVFTEPAEPEPKSDVEPAIRPEPRPRGMERVATQADDPATVDELGRRPFAEVIAARIEEVWKTQSAKDGGRPAGAFMVHIHGPWGSGKTSVLNFLRAHLQDGKRPRARRWVVVEYNAWRNQRIRPPWWTLIKEIYTQSARQLGFWHSLWLRVQWLVWRVRADLLPALLAIALVLLAVVLAVWALSVAPRQTDARDAAQNATRPAGEGGGARAEGKGASYDPVSRAELGIKLLVAAVAAVGALFALSRSLVFGSARAAQTYTELRSDPLRPIVRLFQKLVGAVGRPVLVLIDDMDRCDGAHVVELLEGIQTLFRTAPVTYVVAADRKWICSSFEKGFADFGKTIGEPGRPLGYLFLDKVFQVSASIPRLSPETRSVYWKGLLRSAGTDDPGRVEKVRLEAEQEAERKVKNVVTQQELQAKIAKERGHPVREQAMRAAAAKQITSAEARPATEHLLHSFEKLLEPNPRSMKRLVNAFGLNQATQFLEGRNVSPEALARWTIIELRWPLLADLLAARPQFVADLAEGQTPADRGIPGDLKKLFTDAEVKAVVAGDSAGHAALNEEGIRSIVGLSRPAAQPGADAASGQGGGDGNRED